MSSAAEPELVGFAGLGAMGWHMAAHMSKLPGTRCLVWNRDGDKAQRHAAEHGSVAVETAAGLAKAKVVVFCLPTSVEDAEVAEEVGSSMAAGGCIVSCTSGEPTSSRKLAESLLERFGLHFVDCPVSGGPRGAAAGTLTCMLGANDEAAAEKVLPVVKAFAGKVVRCGPAGAGHAVKAINNSLNCAHLLLGAEGFLALQSFGVDPAVAAEAINGSSGRSLQTMERLPQEVFTGRFSYGFKLPLMAKDCRIAAGVLRDGFPKASLLPAAVELVQQAAAEEAPEADYTRIVNTLERRAGAELRSGPYGPAK